MTESIWILEDDEMQRQVLSVLLEPRFSLSFFATAESLQKKLAETTDRPSLFIVDLLLGDKSMVSGGKFQLELDSPMVVCSSVDDIEVMRLCYQNGAAGYLVKPFKRSELLIAIERAAGLGSSSVWKDLVVDFQKLTVKRRGFSSIELTPKEMSIFSELFKAGNKDVPRSRLLEAVWGKVKVSGKALDVHLFNLRRKLDALSIQIACLEGGSYEIRDADASASRESSSQTFSDAHSSDSGGLQPSP